MESTTVESSLDSPSWLLYIMISVVPCLVIFMMMITRNGHKKVKAPCTSTCMPIIGDAIALSNRPDKHDWMREMCIEQDFKPWLLNVPGWGPIVVISDPASMKHVLQTAFTKYEKGIVTAHFLRDAFGEGIFSADGDKWKHQRRVSHRVLQASSGYMEELIGKHVGKLVNDQLKADAQSGQIIDMQERFGNLTLSVFLELAFGDFKFTEQEKIDFGKALYQSQVILGKRGTRPMFVWKLMRAFRLGTEGELANAIDGMDALVNRVISNLLDARSKESKEKGMKAATEGRYDLVSMFLMDNEQDHSDANNAEVGQSGGGVSASASSLSSAASAAAAAAKKSTSSSHMTSVENIDRQFLRDFILNLILAGRDTSAATLSWLFFELSKHPDCADKAREEIATVLAGRTGDPVIPSPDDCEKMPYIVALLSEALRLYPPVPSQIKYCLKDDTLPNGVFIPKGTAVIYSAYYEAMNPNVWGPDPETFRPERWLAPGKQYSQFEFFSFNAGPRICLGQKLAMLEMTKVVATVLPKYRFEVEDHSVVGADQNSVTLCIQGGLHGMVHAL